MSSVSRFGMTGSLSRRSRFVTTSRGNRLPVSVLQTVYVRSLMLRSWPLFLKRLGNKLEKLRLPKGHALNHSGPKLAF